MDIGSAAPLTEEAFADLQVGGAGDALAVTEVTGHRGGRVDADVAVVQAQQRIVVGLGPAEGQARGQLCQAKLRLVAGARHAGRGVEPDLGRVEQVVAVGVARVESPDEHSRRIEIVGRFLRCAEVVDQIRHLQGRGAVVEDLIGPHHLRTGGQAQTGRGVGVFCRGRMQWVDGVGRLDDADATGRGAGDQAGVQRGVVLARGQADDLRLAGERIGVGVGEVKRVRRRVGHREDIARRLVELHLVLHAGGQAGEGVDAIRSGDGGPRGVANAVDDPVRAAADQRDRLPADARRAVVLQAVTVAVDPDPVAQAGRQQFAKVVVHTGITRLQRDRRDLVVGHRAAERAGAVLAVQVSGRLGLRHRVAAGTQVGEAVAAVGGRGRARRVCAQVVGARQRHQHTGNRRLGAALDTVVVGIDVNIARQACRHQFAEVVVRAGLA